MRIQNRFDCLIGHGTNERRGRFQRRELESQWWNLGFCDQKRSFRVLTKNCSTEDQGIVDRFWFGGIQRGVDGFAGQIHQRHLDEGKEGKRTSWWWWITVKMLRMMMMGNLWCLNHDQNNQNQKIKAIFYQILCESFWFEFKLRSLFKLLLESKSRRSTEIEAIHKWKRRRRRKGWWYT